MDISARDRMKIAKSAFTSVGILQGFRSIAKPSMDGLTGRREGEIREE